ncbi:MAG: hypothetical protein ABI649_03780 [Gaiellaceae bacterium]
MKALAAGVALGLAAAAAVALAPAPAGPTGPCVSEAGRAVAGATELPVGRGLWSLWAGYPPAAGETVTVLWRAEDAAVRPFSVSGRDASGRTLAVEYGPSPVLPQLAGGGLPWRRAGREWGSRLLFPAAGCYLVSARLGERRGGLAVWVEGRR